MIKKLILSIGLFFLSASTVFAITFPRPTGFVNDFANIIPDDKQSLIEQKLKGYKDKTSNEIAVVTTKDLSGLSVEEYSIRLAEAWKPGTKKEDNGVILLVAMKERKIRIEVGQGLEGALTDLEAKSIIDSNISPELKAGNYAKGIDDGVNAIIVSIDGEISPEAASDSTEIPLWVIIVIIAGVVIIFIAISPYTPLGGEGEWGVTTFWGPSGGSSGGSSGGGFGGFGGGGFSGGGSSGSF